MYGFFNLSPPLSTLLVLVEDVGERLRTARSRLGLKQSELAEIGGVSRATQISYESSLTEPNTGYLRAIQATQIDIGLILFDQSKEQIDYKVGQSVDWPTLQQAHEDVEFFCMRSAPNCPQKYRWKLVEKLYVELHAWKFAQGQGSKPQPESLALLSAFWAAFGAA